MATRARSTGGKGKNVSLSAADREYLKESLSKARAKGVGNLDEASIFEALERFGLSSARVEKLRAAIADLDVRESVDKASEYLAEQIENAREYTRENPGKVIGGAAGVLVGASLLALAIRRAAGEERRSTSAKKSAAGRKGGKKSSGGGAKKKSAKTR
jgi:hypothetical protein